MNKKIFCILNDDKTQYLKRYGNCVGIDFIVPELKIKKFFPFYLLYTIVTCKKPDAVLIRYLNDKKSFLYSISAFISNCLTFLFSKVFGIKIIWFCHNVDKETVENYPLLIHIQRRILSKLAKKIYVMDELLVNVAKEKMPSEVEKIDFVSFGLRESNYRRVDRLKDDLIIDLARGLKDKNPDSIIGFCPTNSGDKYLHIEYAYDLVRSAKKCGINIYIILVGDLKDYIASRVDIYNKLSSSNEVIIIDEFIDYDASQVSQYVDFYWRGLDDQSISYSLYEAATQKKATLSLDVGFVGTAVKYYNLGSVVDRNMSNIETAIKGLKMWNSKYADEFLATHSWENTVKKISKAL